MTNAESYPTPPMSVAKWQLLGSGELVGEQGDQVRQFRDALKTALYQGMKVIDIESLMHVATDAQKPLDHQLLDAVKTMSNDNFCLSPNYAWLMGAGFTEFHALRTSGAETSAHGVYFGLWHVSGDPTKGISVAIKPCTSKPETACQDWLNNNLARKEDPRSYEPIGFIYSNGQGYSITKFKRDGFNTLDSTSWDNVLLIESDPEYESQREIIELVAGSLAELHKRNTFHGDPQFKNIVLDIVGEVYLIDWESANFYLESPKSSIVKHKIEHDLKVLFRSIAMPVSKMGVGLMSNFSHSMQWLHFKKYVFDTYMEQYLGGEDDTSQRFEIMADVEARLEQYICDGEIYKSFMRQRSSHI